MSTTPNASRYRRKEARAAAAGSSATPFRVNAPFQVVDRQTRRVIAEIGTEDGMTYFRLFGKDGIEVAELAAVEHYGGQLTILSERGQEVVEVGTHSHGGSIVVRGATDDQDGANVYVYAEPTYADVALSAGEKFGSNKVSVGETA